MHPGVEKVRSWVLARNPKVLSLDPDQELIDSRLVDSLSFVELIVIIEELSGKELDVATLDIDDFRTLTRIERSFFTGPHPVPLA